MKTFNRFLVAFFIAILGIVNTVGLVSANNDQNTDWSDPVILKNIYEKIKEADSPDKSFAELPAEAQNALIKALIDNLEYKTEVTQTYTKGYSDVTITFSGQAPPFGEVYNFNQRIRWDSDGTYVTDIAVHQSWGTAQWPFSYQGILSESETGGVSYTYFRRFSQGIFTMNISGWPAITDNPWIEQWAYGNGSYDYDTGV